LETTADFACPGSTLGKNSPMIYWRDSLSDRVYAVRPPAPPVKAFLAAILVSRLDPLTLVEFDYANMIG